MSTTTQTTTTPSVLYLGASRGVGFNAYTALASARPDIQSILVLRSFERFHATAKAENLPNDILARTKLVTGDAHQIDTLVSALKDAGEGLEAIVTSIGYLPPSDLMGMTKAMLGGFKPDPLDICCRGMITFLKAIDTTYAGRTAPKLVVVSSMGMGAEAHKALAFGLGAMYHYLLQPPHDDKIGMEAAIAKALLPPSSSSSSSSSTLPRFFPSATEAPAHILSPEAYASLPSAFLQPERVCVIRAALMTDGAHTGVYRVIQEGNNIAAEGEEESIGKGLYTISRKDVGDFVARLLSADSADEGAGRWWGRQPVVGY